MVLYNNWQLIAVSFCLKKIKEPESSPDKKWDKSNSNNKFANGAESPKSARKRFGSASEDTLLKVNGVSDGSVLTAQDMEAFKVELIKEVRKEFQKIKQEIVDGKMTFFFILLSHYCIYFVSCNWVIFVNYVFFVF